MSLHEEVRARRVALGLSQDELARRAGIYRDSISNLEVQKTRKPRATTVHAVLRALTEAEAEAGVAPPPAPAPASAPEPLKPNVIRVTVEGMYGGDKNMVVEVPTTSAHALPGLVDRIMSNLVAHHQAQVEGTQ